MGDIAAGEVWHDEIGHIRPLTPEHLENPESTNGYHDREGDALKRSKQSRAEHRQSDDLIRIDAGVSRIWLPSAALSLRTCAPMRPPAPGLLSTMTTLA